MKSYIVYDITTMSDLELFYFEEALELKGYSRLPDRGDFAVFCRRTSP